MAVDITDEEFESIVKKAIDNIPEQYGERLSNLAFVIEDEPNQFQRRKLKLHDGETLFGLYEGVPLTGRGSNYSGVLPDKITIFKSPALAAADNMRQLNENISHTVWHEVAHYFGLGHGRIHELEDKN